jgi:hypothetical protein
MKGNRNVVTWLLSFLKAGGLVTLFLLPFTLAATPSSEQSVSTPLSDPDTYDPAVKQLLDTTYLGHANNLPDPGEPAEVLEKYLEQNAHGYYAQLTEQSQKLNSELAAWEALARQYPQSRHALVGLAKHYRTKAQESGDIGYTRQAATAYLQAAEIGLARGHILYPRQLSELLVELDDTKGLDEIFERMLAQPKDSDPDSYYLALMYYADGLAQLGDDRAWGYFEEAIDFHPENNLEAINRYVRYLLDQGQAQKAFEVLDTHLTSEQRVVFGLPAFLRQEAVQQASLDTASADAEVATIKQFLSEGPLLGGSSPEESGNETTVAFATADSRVSAIFAIPPDDPSTTNDERTIKQDAIFQDATSSPDGVMNNRWLNMLPGKKAQKLATLKWPNGNAGLVRIQLNNNVAFRFFNGSTGQWGNWTGLGPLPSGYAIDVAAVAYANGQADIFAVVNDNCNIYNRHSTDGTTWGSWQWWGSCGDELTVAIRPDGTGWAAMRATGPNGNLPVVRSFNGSIWDNRPIPWGFVPGALAVNDLALTAYANPVNGVRMRLWAIGSNNCSLYASDWNGTSWTNLTLQSSSPCFKQISSFSTSDGGAYLLLLGADDTLYTRRFTGSAWGSPISRGTRKWIATAGVNIDDEARNAYEHTEASDDCRVAGNCSREWCDSLTCYYPIVIGLAEVMFNEAQGEVRGAQVAVGWTVRNRVFQGVSCDVYVGGINYRTTCSSLPCSDPRPEYQDYSRWYCCAIHGAQTQLGTSGYQFNDEHVDFGTLSNAGIPWLALWLLNGRIPDMSTNFVPDGIPLGNCMLGCGTNPYTPTSPPWCNAGQNITQANENGPMEFRASAYEPDNPSCKQVPTADSCQSAADNFVCCNASPNNYFWNRKRLCCTKI